MPAIDRSLSLSDCRYTADVYRIWGNLAYAPDDYWSHAVMAMMFPRYEDSSIQFCSKMMNVSLQIMNVVL